MPAIVLAFAGDSTMTRSRRPRLRAGAPAPLASLPTITPFASLFDAVDLVAGRFLAAAAFLAGAAFVVVGFLVVGISSSTAPLSVGSSGGHTAAVPSTNE